MNLYLIVRKEFYWANLLPVLILIAITYFISLDKILYLIILATPLSVYLSANEFGMGVFLPTEPLLFGVLLFFLLKLSYNSHYDLRIIRHPVTIAIFINLFWILITSITSEIPMVSFKFLLSRLWFIVPMYFVGILLFTRYQNFRYFVWLYVGSFLIVIIYTVIRHSGYGFEEEPGHWVMRPFYNDHTAYGAMLSFFLPVLAGFTFFRGYKFSTRLTSAFFFILFSVALVLAYSRAAWISVAATIVVFIVILLRIRLRLILGVSAVLIAIFFYFQQQIIETLERNEKESSANLVEHLQSISNISSDASNLERINRWQSAIRMFKERPFWGWGPGTYQFLYAPYQRSKEKTIISTNAGDLGNAHSEYIGPLAESGIFGMLTFLAIAMATIYTGIRVFRRSRQLEIRIFSLTAMLSLTSYLVHGFLNNFLDTDKASVPFWGFIALIVALDLYHSGKKEDAPS